jgi:hypothetical protein
MRTRGSGSVSPTSTGKFRVQFVADGRRRSGGVYASRDEAEVALAEGLARLIEGDHRDGVTLAEYGTIALDRRELQGLRSVDRERSRWGSQSPFARLGVDREHSQ